MTHANSTRRSAYLRTLDAECFDPNQIRRATSSPVRAAMHAANAEVRPAADWLSVFDLELEDALAEYEDRRSDGRDTAELAGYIDFLDACIAQLTNDPRFVSLSIEATAAIEELEAVAARRPLARD